MLPIKLTVDTGKPVIIAGELTPDQAQPPKRLVRDSQSIENYSRDRCVPRDRLRANNCDVTAIGTYIFPGGEDVVITVATYPHILMM